MKKELEGAFAIQGDGEHAVKASLDGDRLEVSVGGKKASFSAHVTPDGEVTLRAPDGRVVHAFVSHELGISISGRTAQVSRVEAGSKRGARSAEEAALEAPMPGTCRDVFVRVGDRVEKGARLVLIEAMKMEHELRAPRAGVVKTVSVKKGEPVAPGSPLIELE